MRKRATLSNLASKELAIPARLTEEIWFLALFCTVHLNSRDFVHELMSRKTKCHYEANYPAALAPLVQYTQVCPLQVAVVMHQGLLSPSGVAHPHNLCPA